VPRGWPPLHWREICDCLKALGFVHDRTESSHQIWIHPDRRMIVPVDTNWAPCSGPMVKHLVTAQAQVTREEFYRSTKATSKKL
jgi:predicted RNA binding protein YcfA (HicA-like mRNA interferase family)